jgi:glycosyltransferase involved in cell wall biosynthesis
MKKLRVGVITTEFVTEKYFSGGIANHWYRLFKTITSWGHQVHIFTLSKQNNDSFDYDGLQVHRIKVDQNTSPLQRWLNRLTRDRLRQTIQWLDFSFQVYRRLKQLHQKQPFDIIHMSNYLGGGLVTSLLMRIPYLVMIGSHSPTWHRESGLNRNRDIKGIEWLEWLQYRISPHVYSPSYVLKGIVEKEAQISNVKVIRTPIYLETNDWDSSIYDQYLKGKKYLLFFGRYQLHKGFHILAQALPTVCKTYLDLHVAFVGMDCHTKVAPSMKKYALSICSDYSERLIFLDQLSHSQLYPIIDKARLVVLPSLIDNLPNTLMESMALGKPVIGTIGASFDELITDGENGFLVPIGDVDALADKIVEAWTHPDLEAIGQAAQYKAQELSPERTVKELLEYYEEIITSHKR